MKAKLAVRPMSRREQQRLGRWNAILDVAKQCFLRDGFAATTMSSIAAKLGGSKGTLWSYFSSKEQLLETVIKREAMPMAHAQQLAIDAESDLRSTLTKLLTTLVQRVTSPEGTALFRLVVSESGRIPELGRIFWEGGPGKIDPILTDYLKSQVKLGNLRDADPDEMTNFLISLCTGRTRMRILLNLETSDARRSKCDVDWIVSSFLALYGLGAPAEARNDLPRAKRRS